MRTRFVVAAAALATAATALFFTHEEPARGPDKGTAYLENRLWVDKLPQNEKQMVHYLVAIHDRNERMGTLARASRWRVVADNYIYKLRKKQIEMRFPHYGKKVGFKVSTRKCKGPEPFNLCMELENKDGKKAKFYSREDWELGDLDDAAVELPAWLIAAAEAEPPPSGEADDDQAWEARSNGPVSAGMLDLLSDQP